MTTRTYYLVTPDSPVMGVIKQAQETVRTFKQAIKEVAEEFGGTAWTSGGVYFRGMSFFGEIPSGWRRMKDFAVPDTRTKAGKELAKRFRALPQGVDGMRFSSMLGRDLGGEYTYWGDGHVYFTVYEVWNGTYILSVPSQCEVTLPDCTKLKVSEYWQIREAAPLPESGVTA